MSKYVMMGSLLAVIVLNVLSIKGPLEATDLITLMVIGICGYVLSLEIYALTDR